MGVTPTPASVSGFYRGSSNLPQNISTGACAAVVSGGAGALSYAWTRTDSGPDSWTINSPTGSSTGFTATGVASGVDASATFKVTVTDAAGTKATATVNAAAHNASLA